MNEEAGRGFRGCEGLGREVERREFSASSRITWPLSFVEYYSLMRRVASFSLST